jgi:hypothetical protein
LRFDFAGGRGAGIPETPLDRIRFMSPREALRKIARKGILIPEIKGFCTSCPLPSGVPPQRWLI